MLQLLVQYSVLDERFCLLDVDDGYVPMGLDIILNGNVFLLPGYEIMCSKNQTYLYHLASHLAKMRVIQ